VNEGKVTEGQLSEAKLTRWQPEQWPVAIDWQPVLNRFLATDSARKLAIYLGARIQNGARVFPPQPFRALELTPLNQVKVVVLGQDPYHGAGQAHGLAFSVPPGVRVPPSLRNIQKEIIRDAALSGADSQKTASDTFLTPTPRTKLLDGSLDHWARQGVLLLNTCLTVEEGAPASHAKQGWEVLTDRIISTIWATQSCVVFLLWGAHAQAKQALLQASANNHLVLCANHPSPLSALRSPQPFIGCGHFGLTNAHLVKNGQVPVDW
jgi:uracil-DNA glycosylase